MKFLTDENVATSVVKELRKNSHNVKDVKEEKLFGESDEKIIKLADKEGRILITHDKDFIDLFYSKKIKNNGIIILRFNNQSPNNVKKILVNIINSKIKDKLEKNLTIISEIKVTIHTREKNVT